jgi:MscS family membrane protein
MFRGNDALTGGLRGLALAALVMLAPGELRAQNAEPSATPQAEQTAPAAEKPAPLSKDELSKPMGPPDPLNRGTPRGSMYGFITAGRSGDYAKAADFLDLRRLPPSQQGQGPELARHLKVILDRTLWVDFQMLSDSSDGAGDDGLPAWRDRLGTVETERGPVDLLLQRVPRADDGVRIWKVSAETVARIPDLYDEFGFGPLEKYLPPFFFEIQALDLALWQWLGLLTLVFVAWLLSWLLSSLVIRALRPLFTRTASMVDDRIVALLQSPVRLALGVLVFSATTVSLGLPIEARGWVSSAAQALLILAFTWALLHLVDLAALMTRERLLRTQQPGAVAFLGPGKKTVKVIIVVLAGIALLGNLGFNVTALVAGFGVGGIAVALAAQRTIENLFGGAMLFADRPVRVGDFCRYGDKIGTVEEIGLRSTRVRSLDRTLITIPNAEFSSIQLENFAARDRIRLFCMIGLRYETTPDQLRYVLAKLREMLLAHPKITPDPARVRFVGFGAYSLDLEVFAYAYTSDWNEFLQIREDIFLRVMDIVEEAGTGFAFPSQTMYVGKDEGLDVAHGRSAAKQVAAWRNEGKLPFPEFPPERRSEIQDTLVYPPEGSPGAPRVSAGGDGPR